MQKADSRQQNGQPRSNDSIVEGQTAPTNPGARIDYDLFLDCVHCGLCTASCPTFAELGDENDSPRGRIYLMRAVTDRRLEMTNEVRRHLDLCLDCRACETACPSGVQYGHLIEPFRVGMQTSGEGPSPIDDWFHRWIIFGTLPYPRRMGRLLAPLKMAQRLGLSWLSRMLPARLRRLAEMLPRPRMRGGRLPEILPAVGKPRARVAMFTGCVADVLFRDRHWATARVLQPNGCDVLTPRGQVCCGAIHMHCGSSEPARQFADANVAALKPDEVDAIIVNVAGCGAMLKEYGHYWPDDRQALREQFAAKVKDVHEFLAELGPIAPQGEINLKAT